MKRLLIGTLFIIVITAIVFFLHRASRKDLIANYVAVSARLSSYPSIQELYKQLNPQNTYADNYRNLYYGNIDLSGKTMSSELLKAIADAFLIDNVFEATPTGSQAPMESTPYKGYLFQEDFLGNFGKDLDHDRIAFMAFPAIYGVTGIYVLWIDMEYNIMIHDPKASKGTQARDLVKSYINNTPLSDNFDEGWKSVHEVEFTDF